MHGHHLHLQEGHAVEQQGHGVPGGSSRFYLTDTASHSFLLQILLDVDCTATTFSSPVAPLVKATVEQCTDLMDTGSGAYNFMTDCEVSGVSTTLLLQQLQVLYLSSCWLES